MEESIFGLDANKLAEEFSDREREKGEAGRESIFDLDRLEEEMRAQVKVENLDILPDAQKWLDSLDPSLLQSALEKFALKQTRPIKVKIEKAIAQDGAPEEQLVLVGRKKLGQEEIYILATRSLI